MATIVGVQFQKNGKIYNYDTNGLDLRPEQYVVCDTPHGTDLGQVVVGCRQLEVQDSGIVLKKLSGQQMKRICRSVPKTGARNVKPSPSARKRSLSINWT